MNNTATFSDFEAAADAFKAGIGPKTLGQLKAWAFRKNFGLYQTLAALRRVPLPGISLTRQQNIFDFIRRIDHLRSRLDPLPLPEQLAYLIGQTPLGALCDDDDGLPQVLSLLMQRAAAVEMDRGRFLENLALLSDTDSLDPRAEQVSLLTLHAAKGLEFPVVFVAGCEDGFLPHLPTSGDTPVNMDEEGRLLFVGMTRARQLLFLSRAEKRRIYGKVQPRQPSPFLARIDDGLLFPWDRKAFRKAPPRQKQLGLFD